MSPETPTQSRLDQLATAANAAIKELVHHILVEEGWPSNKPIPDALILPWKADQSLENFVEDVRGRVQVFLAEGMDVQRGRVFCHHCNTSNCEHAQPAQSGDVFVGYGPAGRPRFEAFFNYLLELKDERVDGALKANPYVIARVIGRKRLMGEQLPAYGRGSLKYLIWGQVVAGYWILNSERYAMTLQVVETASRQLRVQVIGHPIWLDRLADDAGATPRGPLASVWELLREVSRKVEAIGNQLKQSSSKQDRNDARDKVFKLLRHFCLGVERKGRQRFRRTKHARKRGDQERPVHKAYDDLQAASSEHFFRDEAKGTVIVLGRSSRVHAFAETGKHITSLTLKKPELERRQKRQRYIPLPPEQARAIQDAASQLETRQ